MRCIVGGHGMMRRHRRGKQYGSSVLWVNLYEQEGSFQDWCSLTMQLGLKL
jgi:hypothetical protein